MNDVLLALLLFLPAGAANGSPVIANRMPGLRSWKTPLDFGKTWRGERIFGTHKTWRGLLSGALVGSVSAILIHLVFPDLIYEFRVVSYTPLLDSALIGAVLGLGALVGDAVESFFKRRAGVKPGGSWFPFDQTDYIVGGLLFLVPFVRLDWWMVIWIVVLYFGLHLVASHLAFRVGLKK